MDSNPLSVYRDKLETEDTGVHRLGSNDVSRRGLEKILNIYIEVMQNTRTQGNQWVIFGILPWNKSGYYCNSIL